jgi:hypothetical protein
MPSDEIVLAEDLPASTISGRVKRGELRKIASGIYTTDLTAPLDTVVRRHAYLIAGRLHPDAVITDRSAPTGGIVNGHLYLSHRGRRRETVLPGLTISARSGAGPLEDDLRLPDGLHQASRGRALAENAQPSRRSKGKERRTLDAAGLEEWVERLCRIEGEDRLSTYRERAEQLAEAVGTKREDLARVSRAIGVAVGSRKARATSHALAARQAGRPYEHERVARFDRLVRALREAAPQSRRIDPNDLDRYRTLPFFEAYFSNYIEGTEFALDEAERIVYHGKKPAARPADTHDLVGTFQIVADDAEMRRRFDNADEFLEAMRARHATIMAGRPENRPGEFKEIANQAGNSSFVRPDLVYGTFVEAHARLRDLDTPWERAAYTMFFVAEIHPFDDGNGRMARIMMNGELVAADETRIIVPTAYRSDYLGALRRLTRDDDPSVFVKAMRYAHDWTFGIDFDDVPSATAQMESTNAFDEGESGRRLLLPPRARDAIAADLDDPMRHAASESSRSFVASYQRADGTPVHGYRKPNT